MSGGSNSTQRSWSADFKCILKAMYRNDFSSSLHGAVESRSSARRSDLHGDVNSSSKASAIPVMSARKLESHTN